MGAPIHIISTPLNFAGSFYINKKISLVFFILGLLALSVVFLIEPYRLETTFHAIKIGEKKKFITIAHVSDLHSKGLNRLEKLLLAELSEHKPDIIVITGDLATPGGTIAGYRELLREFKAPQGVYFVQGNWEYWEPIKDLQQVFTETGIVNLTNKARAIDDDLWLVGFDDALAGDPQTSVLKEVPPNVPLVSLFHSPSFFESISKRVHLALAGHTHGGQVRLPFLGALWLPNGSGNYDQGWFKRDLASMYVSRGLGNSLLPLRFNCRPEIAFIKVEY